MPSATSTKTSPNPEAARHAVAVIVSNESTRSLTVRATLMALVIVLALAAVAGLANQGSLVRLPH